MTTKLESPESTSVSHWLAELHMECYKKNLEHFDTLKPLIDLKDPELKKLGVINSKDRSTMLASLASYRPPPPPAPSPSTEEPDSSPILIRTGSTSDPKSVSRRSSLRNFNLKGLLGSGGSRKSKKSREGMSITTASPLTSSLDLQLPDAPPSSPPPTKMYPIPDYEELKDCDSSSSTADAQHKAVPNEYVPSPQEMEQFRGRAHTVGSCQLPQLTPNEIQLRRLLPEGYSHRDSMATNTTSDEDAHSTTSSGFNKSHHLSVISMESGLSFGYDVEINTSLSLEVQPWFHGKISRDNAAALLRDDGDFLVRENTALANTYTLSMHWRGECDHTLIQSEEVVNSRSGTIVKYSFDGGAFDSIPELIYHHLKYQIPIDKESQNLLMTPIHRPGARVPFNPSGLHPLHERDAVTFPGEQRYSPPHQRGEDSSTYRPELGMGRQQYHLRPLRSTSMSPGASSITSSSTRPSPAREFSLRSSNSSGDLIDNDGDTRQNVVHHRNAVSPPPAVGRRTPVSMRPRAITSSAGVRRPGDRNSKRDSFGDYEVMESVSLLGSPPAHRKRFSHSNSPSPTPVGVASIGEGVKYAEIKHIKKPHELLRRDTYSGPQNSAIKYAEVRFTRKQHSQPAVSPHPFSTYDTVQSSSSSSSSSPGQQQRVNPYQSRAEVLALRMQVDSSPRSSPTPLSSTAAAASSQRQKLGRVESSPHPFSSHYSTHSLPRHTSSTQVMHDISEEVTQMSLTPGNPQQADNAAAKMHSLPDRVRRRIHTPHEAQLSSGLASDGPDSARRSAAERVPQSLPGYEMLVSLHNTLSRSTENELAFHLTRADAVAFLLTPRPGEDKEVWKERVMKTTSSSGLYVGLQTLADTDGEKLWKRLYFRHLALSHMVAVSIVSAGDTSERAHMLKRFIELAFILQSSTYGNLFSFISIMQALTSPQVKKMTQTWQLFHSAFPDTAQIHKQLQDILARLGQGVSMYATDQICIPAIQHLRTVFHFEEPSFPGHTPSSSLLAAGSPEDHTLVGQHTNLLLGLDGIHTIIKHASRFSYNARKRLEPLQYNVKLMDFFSQDFVRNYMHSIGVTSEDQLERRRRFDVLLSALVDRVEASV